MSKRRKLRVIPPGKASLGTVGNGKGSRIGKAIDAVQEPKPAGPQPQLLQLAIHPEPVRLAAPKGIRIHAPAQANRTVILIHDGEGDVWRSILLPPGTDWMLKPAPPAQPRAALWTPGKPR